MLKKYINHVNASLVILLLLNKALVVVQNSVMIDIRFKVKAIVSLENTSKTSLERLCKSF